MASILRCVFTTAYEVARGLRRHLPIASFLRGFCLDCSINLPQGCANICRCLTSWHVCSYPYFDLLVAVRIASKGFHPSEFSRLAYGYASRQFRQLLFFILACVFRLTYGFASGRCENLRDRSMRNLVGCCLRSVDATEESQRSAREIKISTNKSRAHLLKRG